MPLETHYDAGTHQLVAIAPHFSLFRKFVLDPLGKAYDAARGGVQALQSTVQSALDGLWGTLTALATPEQEAADCVDADTSYTVTLGVPQMHGCAITQADPSVLWLENRLLIPMDVTPPQGVDVGPFAADMTQGSVTTVLTRALQGVTGTFLVPARGAERTWGCPRPWPLTDAARMARARPAERRPVVDAVPAVVSTDQASSVLALG